MARIERMTRNEKHTLGLKLMEGKKPISIDVLTLVANHLYTSGATEDIKAQFILLLDWNLMKRAENVMHAKIAHIE